MGYYREKKVGDPKWIAGDEEHDAALAKSGVTVDALSRVSGRPTSWLVENVIADEAVTVVAGEPGAGKTFIGCQIAADVARELEHRVVLATAGDERPELLRWRLDQAEGDARRVALAALEPTGFYDRRRKPSDDILDERMAILYHTLQGAGDPTSGILPAQINLDRDDLPSPRAARLLVIDDVDGWFGKPGNMLSAAALARVIQRLNELARSLRLAIVVLVRMQLSVEGRITTRQLSRLSQAASVVWTVVKDREGARETRSDGETEGSGGRGGIANCELQNANCKLDQGPHPNPLPEGEGTRGNPKSKIENPKSPPPAYSQSARRWFLPVKNNLAPDAAAPGRSFELVDGRIRWHCDDPAPELAEALLPSAHNSDRRRVRNAAMAWIKEALAAGPMPSDELYQEGMKNGFSKGTLLRAAAELGIHSHKTGFSGGWEMRWVPPVAASQGTTLRAKPWELRVVGEGERGRRSDGGKEGRREESEAASCAPSMEREELEAASCASSMEHEESGAARCDRPDKPPNWHEVVVDALREAC